MLLFFVLMKHIFAWTITIFVEVFYVLQETATTPNHSGDNPYYM